MQNYLVNAVKDIYENYSFEKIILSDFTIDNGVICQRYIDIDYQDMEYINRITFSDFDRRCMFVLCEQYSKLGDGYGKALNRQEINDYKLVRDEDLLITIQITPYIKGLFVS
jgi:hypothetical protein